MDTSLCWHDELVSKIIGQTTLLDRQSLVGGNHLSEWYFVQTWIPAFTGMTMFICEIT